MASAQRRQFIPTAIEDPILPCSWPLVSASASSARPALPCWVVSPAGTHRNAGPRPRVAPTSTWRSSSDSPRRWVSRQQGSRNEGREAGAGREDGGRGGDRSWREGRFEPASPCMVLPACMPASSGTPHAPPSGMISTEHLNTAKRSATGQRLWGQWSDGADDGAVLQDRFEFHCTMQPHAVWPFLCEPSGWPVWHFETQGWLLKLLNS